VNQANISATWY